MITRISAICGVGCVNSLPLLAVIVCTGLMAADQAVPPVVTPIDGQTYLERTRAFLGYCATAKPRREDYPKEAMAYPGTYRIPRGRAGRLCMVLSAPR